MWVRVWHRQISNVGDLAMFLAALALQAASSADKDYVAEVRAHLDAEQAAFRSGRCSEAVAHWALNLSMVVEGHSRASSREELETLCNRIMLMVAEGKIPSGAVGQKIISQKINMLSADIAYSITERLTPAGDRSSVTKVVVRTATGWQIAHMHEAIASALTKSK